jgi:hypothetical protein
MVKIRNLKKNYVKKYPNSQVSAILLSQPDSISTDSFLTLAQALLSLVDEG